MTPRETAGICHLLIVHDLTGQRLVPLDAGTYSIGRDPKNSIMLNAQAVSRQHAMLLRVTSPDSDLYWFRIIDGGLNSKRSTNGVYVNGRRILSHDLRHGDLVEFGVHAVKADYYALSNLPPEDYTNLLKSKNPAALLANLTASDRATVVSEPIASSESSEASILRLASFPELMESPVVELNLAGYVTYANPAALQQFPNLQREAKEHLILQGIILQVQAKREKHWHRTVNMDDRWFHQAIHYLAEGELVRIFMTDVTDRQRAKLELQKRDCLLQAVADASAYLLTEMDYTIAIEKALNILGQVTEVDRVCIYENHPDPTTGKVAMSLRFEWHRLGLSPLQPLAHSQNCTYEALGLQPWYKTLQKGQVIQGRQRDFPLPQQEWLQQNQVESILVHGLINGPGFWGHLSFQDCRQERVWSQQEIATLLTLANSLSATLQRHQTQKAIEYRATHDPLTGLVNRSSFDEHLIQAIQTSRRNNTQLAVMFLDLDRFKEVNDRLGHTVGDHLLQTVAQRITALLPKSCLLSRWGGDEFTLLIPEVENLDQVKTLAQNILESFNQSFSLRGHELFVSVSIGVALGGNSHSFLLTADNIVRQADVALYKAKSMGRNGFAVYQPQDGSGAADLSLERDLRYALDRNELQVFYQPQVDLITHRIIGLEALLRWKHPDRGMVSPGIFIPVAEDRGWIVEIGEWVLRQACAQIKQWQEANLPPVVVSVNLSLRQFRQPQLVQIVQQILAQTDVNPACLELEITESAAVDDLLFTRSLLDQLYSLGVRLSIDDFGTGHSSLHRLQTLPLHTLKIDQSFVREMSRDTRVAHIVAAIVTLGHNLGLDLIAEGVEHLEQAQFLRSIHCKIAQGFLFYKPLPADQVTEILTHVNLTHVNTSSDVSS